MGLDYGFLFCFLFGGRQGNGKAMARKGNFRRNLSISSRISRRRSIDIMARQLAKLAEKEFGQRLNVVNKTGGSGIVAVVMSCPSPRMDTRLPPRHGDNLDFTDAQCPL